ncbi:MAG: rRNA maturation RNase YbeY [Planctomycetes bacterium]|nr:rRNA maturation RNase YbeY [Planctomycetota bacterium]
MKRRSPRPRTKPTTTPHQLSVEISCTLPVARSTIVLLRRATAHALQCEDFRHGELSIVVVGARRMAALHKRTLNIAGATDVLTFDYGSDRRRGIVLGEIVVCRDVAASNARTHGVAAELALYVVHGVLHLAGHDDRARADFVRMHRRENKLLAAIGLGEIFGTV